MTNWRLNGALRCSWLQSGHCEALQLDRSSQPSRSCVGSEFEYQFLTAEKTKSNMRKNVCAVVSYDFLVRNTASKAAATPSKCHRTRVVSSHTYNITLSGISSDSPTASH